MLMIRYCCQCPLFSLIPCQKLLLATKLTLKFDCAASTESHGNYLNYVSFPWRPLVTANNTLYYECRWWIKAVEEVRSSSSQNAIEVSIPTTRKSIRGSELRKEGQAKKQRNTMSNSKQYSPSYDGYPIESITINRHHSYHLCRPF